MSKAAAEIELEDLGQASTSERALALAIWPASGQSAGHFVALATRQHLCVYTVGSGGLTVGGHLLHGLHDGMLQLVALIEGRILLVGATSRRHFHATVREDSSMLEVAPSWPERLLDRPVLASFAVKSSTEFVCVEGWKDVTLPKPGRIDRILPDSGRKLWCLSDVRDELAESGSGGSLNQNQDGALPRFEGEEDIPMIVASSTPTVPSMFLLSKPEAAAPPPPSARPAMLGWYSWEGEQPLLARQTPLPEWLKVPRLVACGRGATLADETSLVVACSTYGETRVFLFDEGKSEETVIDLPEGFSAQGLAFTKHRAGKGEELAVLAGRKRSLAGSVGEQAADEGPLGALSLETHANYDVDILGYSLAGPEIADEEPRCQADETIAERLERFEHMLLEQTTSLLRLEGSVSELTSKVDLVLAKLLETT
eukprot:scaffold1954_cov268-Pinguiococcus_pyrenoidosus.AAC.18